jgi:rifampicin phosphotransferase
VPTFTVAFSELCADLLDQVGGKGANLVQLRRAGMPVPDGFCLTTQAFTRFLAGCPDLGARLHRLDELDVDDRDAVERAAADLRALLGSLPVPAQVRTELLDAWRRAGDHHTYAVRSSATAEDLADASFAGQHDTFLNVDGADELVDSVRRCWLSLFTGRAITYRARHGFDHRRVELAVVVQRMVLPEVSGVMFTADPVSGHRRTILVNAAYGLGEAVVSGVVNPDLYRIDEHGAVEKSIMDKKLAVVPLPSGGVAQEDVPDDKRTAQALPDRHIAELAALGRRIQEHFGAPQDIEWALADGRVQVLQSRPITSLYPLPETPDDRRLHVYFSFGHQQMMTEAMKPLALSVLRTYFPFGRRQRDGESTRMVQAGNRLFFDYTSPLHTRLGRMVLARAAGAMDKRVGDAIMEISARPEFRAHHRPRLGREPVINAFIAVVLARVAFDLALANMTTKLARTERFLDRSLVESRAAIEGARGADVIDEIRRDLRTFPMRMFFRVNLTQVTAIFARDLVERLCRRWLGAVGDLAELGKSLPGNVTTEMGLAIGDLADLARDKPDLLAMLKSPPASFTLDALDAVPGGAEFRVAFGVFLDRYGMRGSGEVDLTRVRWGEQPAQLFAGILANTRAGGAGEHRARFLAGERDARLAAARLLGRVRATRFGRQKAVVLSRLITVYRTMLGLREHPKFVSVCHFDLYRRAIRLEALALVDKGILAAAEDADYLSLDELGRVLTGRAPAGLAEVIAARRREHAARAALTVPRLFTSDGEIVNGAHAGPRREGVLVGCPVSAGVVEGRARVVLRPQDAELHEGDILVAPFTDPSWTPLFSAVRGMVLEIGGVMTHGAVVARELGLPTVVGVDDATRLIKDGARIRVDGSLGVVEPAGGGR